MPGNNKESQTKGKKPDAKQKTFSWGGQELPPDFRVLPT